MQATLFDKPETTGAEDKILEYLMRGNSLTVNDCLRLFHTTELRKYISNLKAKGYGISAERKTVVCSDGHKASIGIYKIAI